MNKTIRLVTIAMTLVVLSLPGSARAFDIEHVATGDTIHHGAEMPARDRLTRDPGTFMQAAGGNIRGGGRSASPGGSSAPGSSRSGSAGPRSRVMQPRGRSR